MMTSLAPRSIQFLGYSFENFQRLEDFPSYTSVIRCFGKPIIPPLLTNEERIKIAELRTSVSLLQGKKSLNLPKKPANFSCSHAAAETSKTPHNFSNNIDISCEKSCNQDTSASSLSPQKVLKTTENELFVSMSKIPCNGVCSTVHDGVIVCPNETPGNIHYSNSNEFESSSNSEYWESCNENGCDCQECQIKIADTDVPYKNTSSEQMHHSVSDDDQESVAEEADFESLPTVIYNRKILPQDTDSESIVTCMTQSTDLDKYMDYSIEYSSPDDNAGMCQHQSSTQRSASSRSDDTSTATIVNTESELTPCVSAVAELPSCLESLSDIADSSSIFVHENAGATFNANCKNPSISMGEDTSCRAYSVDSYMKILKTCAKNLYLKKYHSEPSHPNSKQSHTTSECLTDQMNNLSENESEVSLPDETVEDTKAFCDENSFGTENVFVDDSEQTSGDAQRKLIRRNSYTLLQPSSALIMAHASCSCQEDSLMDDSPHSCSSAHQNENSNPAFKKETVVLVLPSTSDRETFLPILHKEDQTKDLAINESLSPSDVNLIDTENCHFETEGMKYSSASASSAVFKEVDKDSSNLPPNIVEPYAEYENKENGNSSNVSDSFHESSSLNQQNIEKSNGTELLAKLLGDLRENQQLEMKRFIEEQKKHLLRIQEEFQEQEKILFENLKSAGVPVFASINSSSSPADDIVNTQMASSDSNSTNLSSETETFQTVIQNEIHQKSPPSTLAVTEHDTICNPISQVNDILTTSKSNEATYLNQHQTNETTYSTQHQTNEATYSTSHQVNEATYSTPHQINEVTYSTQHQTNDALYSTQHQTNEAAYSTNHRKIGEKNVVQNTLSNFKQICIEPLGSELYETDYNSCAASQLPTCTFENITNFHQVPVSTFIRNDIGDMTAPICSANLRNTCTKEKYSPIKLTNKIHSPKLVNKLSTQSTKHPSTHCSGGATYNSSRPPYNSVGACVSNESVRVKNNFEKRVNQHPASNLEISKNNGFQVNEVTGVCNKIKRSNVDSNNVTSSASARCDGRNSLEPSLGYSNSSKMNISNCASADFYPQASKNITVQKSINSINPLISVKAMKLVPPSLTNLKRKQSKNLNDPEMLKRFERLPALVKGYLTRRLYKTERVQRLIQTMKETAKLAQNLSEDLTQKGNTISESDMDLYNQLLAQLLSSFEDVYDIFCTISTKERMNIIAESRELWVRKKKAEQSSESSNTSLVMDRPLSVPAHKPKVTAATIKRRKRSLVDSRTHAISDFREHRTRACSVSSLKSNSVSPSRIYQTSLGVNVSRKTKKCMKPSQTQHWK
ncbi:uncharacterized protein [Parasteatoda tepidariorum]|uniref:uncharacterized protein isoform X1 n=1 Tax=Parasteatoda tepidariorum TaxID=114398 RepID=UPI0039BD418F